MVSAPTISEFNEVDEKLHRFKMTAIGQSFELTRESVVDLDLTELAIYVEAWNQYNANIYLNEETT